MLRQIQIAYSLKDQITITEKFPLLFYIVENGLSKFVIKSEISQKGLHNLKCTCPFFHNYHLICWHQIAVLEKLQIKNINMFENLQKFRDIVGRRVITARVKSEMRSTTPYTKKDVLRVSSRAYLPNIKKG